MSTGIAPIDEALLPANVRHGTSAQKSAYATALGFEQMLVDELSKELASTAGADSGSGDGSDSGADSGSGDSSGLLGGGGDPANNAYAQLLPTALSAGVMAAGGLGIARQIAESITPASAAVKR